MKKIKILFKTIILSGIFSSFWFGMLLGNTYYSEIESQIAKIVRMVSITIAVLCIAFLVIKATNDLFDIINSKDELLEEIKKFCQDK